MSINLINYALAKKDWEKAYEDLKVLGVGGRNLLLNSQRIYITPTTRYVRVDLSEPIKPGEKFTVSIGGIDIINQQKPHDEVYVSFRDSQGNPTGIGIGLGSATVPIGGSYTGYIPADTEGQFDVILFYSSDRNEISGNEQYYLNLKLERGNKATDWTPAPEDIGAHPFVAELAETVFRSKQNEERIRNLENAITALGLEEKCNI